MRRNKHSWRPSKRHKPTKPATYHKGCTGKVQYRNRREAEAKVKQMQAASSNPKYDALLNVYECAHCGRFHVGHGNGRRPERQDSPESRISELEILDEVTIF